MNTTLAHAHYPVIASHPVRHCDVCGSVSNITVNRNHFCGPCLKAKRVLKFLLEKGAVRG